MPALAFTLLTPSPRAACQAANGGKTTADSTPPSKNIADGAAKGQATDSVFKRTDSISPGKNISDGAAKGQATDSVFKRTDSTSPGKNISDGAAKGQATDSVFKRTDSTSPGKNISDGAAKGQASEGIAPNPNGGSGASKTDHSSGLPISTGAAKSQAVDGMVHNPNGGSGGGKSTGAAKSINPPNRLDSAARADAAPGQNTSARKGKTGHSKWGTFARNQLHSQMHPSHSASASHPPEHGHSYHY